MNSTANSNKRSEHPTVEDGRDSFDNVSSEPPSATPDPITSQVLSLTERELQELSQADQEQVVYDLYGFSGPIDESTEGFVEQKMVEMQTALDQIPDRRKMAYRLALEIDSAFVNNHRFKLQFLRADRFQPTHAATRLVTHLENKLDLFGRELLCKEITQDDLDPQSLELLYKTWYVDVPVRDRAGRQVVVQLSKPGVDCYALPVKERMQVLFYTLCVAARDPETQIHGRVTLLWVAGSLGKASSVWKIAQMHAGAPIRQQGLHMCVDAQHFYSTPMVAIAQMSLNSMLRIRVRRHIGTPNEIKYALMTYGIPTEYIPIGEDGEFAHQLHYDRWDRIRNQERWLKQQGSMMFPREQSPQPELEPPLQPEQAGPEAAAAAAPSVPTNVAPANSDHVAELSLKDDATASTVAKSANQESDLSLKDSTKPSPGPKSVDQKAEIKDTTTPSPAPDSPIASAKPKASSEEKEEEQPVVDTPTNQDVLMGKGRGSQNHIGNVRFRKLIEKCRPQYDTASKTQKTQLAKEIIRVVREEWHGRFLREDIKGWIPIEDDLAIRRKVSVAFRDARKPAKGKKQSKGQQPAADEQEDDFPPLNDPSLEDIPAIDLLMVALSADA